MGYNERAGKCFAQVGCGSINRVDWVCDLRVHFGNYEGGQKEKTSFERIETESMTV